MKYIWYAAALLTLFTAAWHLISVIDVFSGPNGAPLLVFGIIYVVVGIFLLFRLKYALLMGILFPLLGLAGGFFVMGIKNWNTSFTVMFLIDAMIVILCALLLLQKKVMLAKKS